MLRIINKTALALLTGLASACAPSSAENIGDQSDPLRRHVGEPPQTPGQLEAFTVVLDGPSAASLIPRGMDARSPEAAVITRARVRAIQAEHAALEPALTRHGARVTARLSRLANAVQILADEAAARRIERLPGVVRVERVALAERALGSAVPLIGAPKLWAGVPMLQGDGVTIGIIDSGIDYTHADFGGPGTAAAYKANDGAVLEPGSFPTAKVVGGWDFVGDTYNPSGGNSVPQPDADPLDCAGLGGDEISGGHGTHVAGIAAGAGVLQDGSSFAGPYEATFDASIFRVAPGVAPRARLYALRIFGCEGSTNMVDAALDRAADPDDDGSFADRLDVVNLSLGTPYALGSQTTAKMITALTKAGTLVVAAAGNEGQNFFVTGSPAVHAEALSVAASVDNDLLVLQVTSPASAAASYPAAEAVFTRSLASTGPLSLEVVAASPLLGCAALTNAAEVAGKIAVMDRGTCTFVEKLGHAAAAGAIAGIVIDNEDAALPFAMSGADPGTVPIPGFMLRLADGAALESALGQGKVTAAVDPAQRFTGPGAELLAGLSSRGPSAADGRFKPEISAPGVLIASAGVATGADATQKSGTSMAAPLVAGAAALVRQARPSFSPLEVKAALMNTGASLSSAAGVAYGTGAIGGGRVNVLGAATTQITAAADPTTGEVGVSFGAVVADAPTTVKRTFVVHNHGAGAVSLDASVVPSHAVPGLSVSVAPALVQVAAGQSATVELTLSLDPSALGAPGPDPGVPATQGMQTPAPRHFLNEASGVVRLAGAGEALALPYNGSVRAAVRRKGVPPSVCSQIGKAPEDGVEIALEGSGAHPQPVVTAFQLGALDEVKAGADTDPVKALMDVRAVGVATDLATAGSFDAAQVFFGVAITGTWTTPARGPVSIVSIEINTDQKGAAEYSIRVEARNAEAPFRDALVASTYNVATGERVARYPVNIVTPDVASTHPFHSSVLVLSAHLAEIGVAPEGPVFGWTAVTESPSLLIQGDRVKGTFDPTKPLVDTARHGMNGAPLFLGAGPVRVHVSPEARAAGTPLDVLLLHHTNVPGERWEVVSLPMTRAGNLTLAAQAPASVAASATTQVTLVVTNDGAAPAPGVKVGGSVAGGELVRAEAPQGSCAPGAALDCAIGEVAAGASVTITATVRAPGGSKPIVVNASVTSDLACETATADNDAAAAIEVLAAPAPKPPSLVASGGCGCRTGAGETTPLGGLAAAALGLLAARRRRGSRGGSYGR